MPGRIIRRGAPDSVYGHETLPLHEAAQRIRKSQDVPGSDRLSFFEKPRLYRKLTQEGRSFRKELLQASGHRGLDSFASHPPLGVKLSPQSNSPPLRILKLQAQARCGGLGGQARILPPGAN
jgi:hypothetical protein